MNRELQGVPPGRGPGVDVRAGHQVVGAGGRRQARCPRWSARRSSWPRPNGPAPSTWPCPRTWKGRRRRTTTGRSPVNVPRPDEPSPGQVERAAASCARRAHPSCWPGTARPGRTPAAALRRFAEALGIPVATTFHGKGVFPDDHPLALGRGGVHAPRLRQLRLRPGGRDHRRRLRAAGVRPGADQPARRQARSSTCTGSRPRWTRTTTSPSACTADIGRSLDALADAVGPRPAATPGGNRIRALAGRRAGRGQRG